MVGPTGKEDPYVLSERLGTAQKAEKMMSKMKGDDPISRRGRDLALKMLKRENEALKPKEEEVPTMQSGGTIDPSVYHINKIKRTRDQSAGLYDTQPINTLPGSVGRPTYKTNLLPTLDFSVVPQNKNTSIALPNTDSKTGIAPTLPTETGSTDNTMRDVGLGLKGAALAGSVIDAFQKPEVVNPRFTDRSKSDQYFNQMGTSYMPVLNEINLGVNKGLDVARGSSRTFGQFANRTQSAVSRGARDASQARMQEKQYMDTVRQMLGSREDQISQIDRGEQVRTDVANEQNRAMRQDLIANTLQNVNNLGTELTKQQYLRDTMKDMNAAQRRQFALDLAAIQSTTPNFKIDKDALMKAAESGDIEAIMKAIKFTE